MSKLDEQIKEAMAELDADPGMEQFAELFSKVFGNMMRGGMSPLESMGLSVNVLERYYSQANKHFESGQFVEASKILRMIALLAPSEFRFVFAYAACKHRTQEYIEALAAYQMATITDPTDPLPYYHAADCLEKLGFVDGAAESLRIALENCSKPEHASIKDRANMALKALQEKKPAATQKNEKPVKQPMKKSA